MSNIMFLFMVTDGVILGLAVFTLVIMALLSEPKVRKWLVKWTLRFSTDLCKEIENEEEP